MNLAGVISAMPQKLAGRGSKLCSRSFDGGLPVSAGISLVLMVIVAGGDMRYSASKVRLWCLPYYRVVSSTILYII